jgi:signal transduction histidine kinase
MKRLSSNLVATTILAAAYFCSGKLGLQLAFVNASATAVWPPAGIALAAVLLLGNRVWPGIWLGAFLVNVTTQGTIATSLGIATGNTLEAVLGAWLVGRFADGPGAMEEARSIFKFVFLAAVCSTAVSATFGVTSLALGGYASWDGYGAVWLTWWLGDLVSDLTIAPLLIIWCRQPSPRFDARRTGELAFLLLLVWFVSEFVFGGWFTTRRANYPLEYAGLPALLWAAFRFGSHGAAAAAFVMSAAAIWGTLRGHGPFATNDPNESLLLLQAFMGVMTLTGLVLAAAVGARRRAEAVLRESHGLLQASAETIKQLNLELEQRVERRTAELREKNNELEAFCYSIAHDLRAPLRAMQGLASALAEDYGPALDKVGHEYTSRIKQSAQCMDELIQDLLDYSRISRDELKLSPVDLEAAVREVVVSVDQEIERKGATVRLRGRLPGVMAHRTTLVQMLANLFSNALKFVQDGAAPRIEIWTEDCGRFARLWMADNGIGIDSLYHEQIFGVFERLHGSDVYPGTGIGLAIVRKGAERMGGRAGVESKPGEGSQFWIELLKAERPDLSPAVEG